MSTHSHLVPLVPLVLLIPLAALVPKVHTIRSKVPGRRSEVKMTGVHKFAEHWPRLEIEGQLPDVRDGVRPRGNRGKGGKGGPSTPVLVAPQTPSGPVPLVPQYP